MKKTSRLRPATLVLLLALLSLGNSSAQVGGTPQAPPPRTSRQARGGHNRRAHAPRAKESPGCPAPATTPPQPRGVVSSVESYNYRLDANTPLCVKLAPLGQVVIEFQANDPVYKVHPSNENFVAVDRLSEDSLITDPVVLRPGSGFRVGRRGEATPATVVNLQMYSGAIIPVIVVPVNDIAENTLRVAITYDRDKVEHTRQALGLAVNLEQLQAQAAAAGGAPAAPTEAVRTSAPAQPAVQSAGAPPDLAETARATQVVAPSPAPAPVAALPAPSPTPSSAAYVTARPPLPTAARRLDAGAVRGALVPAVVKAESLPPRPAPSPTPSTPPAGERAAFVATQKVVARTRDELLSVVRGNLAGKFSKPLHGLAVAVSPSHEIDEHNRVVVVAVRNTLKESVRLVPGHPELAVEILDDKKRLVDSRALPRLYMQTTLKDGVIGPGETGYYAVVFESPILGTHEYLRARAAQVFAADAPAAADLVITAR